MHMHRLAQVTSEKTACAICAGIKLHLSCTIHQLSSRPSQEYIYYCEFDFTVAHCTYLNNSSVSYQCIAMVHKPVFVPLSNKGY